MKIEYSVLHFLFNLYSTEYTAKIRYLMYKLLNFTVFLQIFTHFEFDVCNTFQNS